MKKSDDVCTNIGYALVYQTLKTIVAIYPFMKRFTDWPQLFLGLAFSWGALMGWAVVWQEIALPSLLLYAGAILWTIGYDTIYAHQDKEDDALVGVRSTARLFGKHTKTALSVLYPGALFLFAAAFMEAEVPLPAMAGLVAASFHMMKQIRVLDIDNPDQCLALFKSNSTLGWLVFLGLLGGAVWASISPGFCAGTLSLRVFFSQSGDIVFRCKITGFGSTKTGFNLADLPSLSGRGVIDHCRSMRLLITAIR